MLNILKDLDAYKLMCELLYAVIIVTIPILARYLSDFIISYSDKVQADVEQSDYAMMLKYVKLATDSINDVVIYFNQTLVNEMKKNGTFNKEVGKEVFAKALDRVKASLTEDIKLAIQTLYGDVDNFLETRIEKAVNENKL